MTIGKALCLIAVMSLTASAQAQAVPVTVVTAFAYTYAPGDAETPSLPLRVSQGGRVLYSNADPLGYHSIAAYDLDEEGDPLFYAPLSGTGEVNEVAGVPRLAPGRYEFYCDVHGAVMEGVLVVTPSIP